MWLLIVFIIQQILDGIFTWHGIHKEGINFEVNNLLFFYFNAMGIFNTLLFAKIFAIGFGIFLYEKKCRKILFALNIVYFFVATLPHFYFLYVLFLVN